MIVLDTHAWLWWVAAPKRLSKMAAAAIAEADSIGISSISAWEIAMLERRGRIALDRSAARWVSAAIASDDRVHEIPVDSAIAVRAAEMEERGMHADPADRFIFASAEFFQAALVTKDRGLRKFDAQRTIW